MTPPGKQNPASSLPQQEKREGGFRTAQWIARNVDGVWMVQIGTLCVVTSEANALALVAEHNATLSEPKPETKAQVLGPIAVAGVREHAIGVSSDEEIAKEAGREFAEGDSTATDANFGALVDYYASRVFTAIRKAKSLSESPAKLVAELRDRYAWEHDIDCDAADIADAQCVCGKPEYDKLLDRIASLSEPKESEEEKRICRDCGFDAKDPTPVCPVCGGNL